MSECQPVLTPPSPRTRGRSALWGCRYALRRQMAKAALEKELRILRATERARVQALLRDEKKEEEERRRRRS